MINPVNSNINVRPNKKIILLLVIIIALVIIFSFSMNSLFFGSNSLGRLSNWADVTKYQAVFLTNGQVYFGKVADVNSQTLVLENIYYLRSNSALQTGLPAQAGEATTTSQLADNFALIKLGNEIHGPLDRMSINLSQVLFTEDLKDNSTVVEAIKGYESRK